MLSTETVRRGLAGERWRRLGAMYGVLASASVDQETCLFGEPPVAMPASSASMASFDSLVFPRARFGPDASEAEVDADRGGPLRFLLTKPVAEVSAVTACTSPFLVV